MRDLKGFQDAVLDIQEDQQKFLIGLVVMLEDTYLNTKDKRLEFAKEVRNRLDLVHHFVNEEKRLRKEEKEALETI